MVRKLLSVTAAVAAVVVVRKLLSVTVAVAAVVVVRKLLSSAAAVAAAVSAAVVGQYHDILCEDFF